jgi:hypothetical protein
MTEKKPRKTLLRLADSGSVPFMAMIPYGWVTACRRKIVQLTSGLKCKDGGIMFLRSVRR